MSSSASATGTSASTSATAYRVPSVVQQVTATRAGPLSTPPGCRETVVFDMTEGDSEMGEFELDNPNVFMVKAVKVKTVERHALDATDDDGDWLE